MTEIKRRKSDVEILLVKQELTALNENLTKAISDMAEILHRHDKEIFGDQEYLGQKGEIGILKDSGKKRIVRERLLFSGIIGLIIEAIIELFKAKGHP